MRRKRKGRVRGKGMREGGGEKKEEYERRRRGRGSINKDK